MFQDFFWGDTSGPKAQKALGNKPEGTFLIRFSSKDSNYTLSFVGGKKIWHTRIIHPYAQNKFAVLIIFQAMDAAGKDSTIKHVMSGVNPQGCQVYSFQAPSQEELDHDYLWRNHLGPIGFSRKI